MPFISMSKSQPCTTQSGVVNQLPDNKILDCSKFKALADNKINGTKN